MNEIRNYFEVGSVDVESGIYNVGYGAGVIEGSLAVSGVLAVRYAGFRGPEYGRWKDSGAWQEGWHFHLGTGGGLQKYHLPQQLGRWWNNLKGIAKRKGGK